MKGLLSKAVAFAALSSFAIAPVTVNAQSYKHRQQKKNEWRNLAYGAGALGALGFLTKNNTLGWAGLAGAGYSAWRYEQDRKAQSRMRGHTYSLRRRHRH
jgi:opacity protein-like surface antigen